MPWQIGTTVKAPGEASANLFEAVTVNAVVDILSVFEVLVGESNRNLSAYGQLKTKKIRHES